MAARGGVMQIELSAGEGLANHPEIASIVRYYGAQDYTHYLLSIFQQTATANGRQALLPVPNLGGLSLAQLRRFKSFVPCMKLLLESVDPKLQYRQAHAGAPCKAPEKRVEAILLAGQAAMPLTTGIMVGIGETRASRYRALEILGEIQRRYGHLQNVVIEPFRPMANTAMAGWPRPSANELLECVDMAHRIFGPDFPVTLAVVDDSELLPEALEAGVNDFGDIAITGDAAQDRETLHRLRLVRAYCESRGVSTSERLAVFPSFQTERWLEPHLLRIVRECQKSIEAAMVV